MLLSIYLPRFLPIHTRVTLSHSHSHFLYHIRLSPKGNGAHWVQATLKVLTSVLFCKATRQLSKVLGNTDKA